jgi:hypothetical protein
MLGYLNRDIDGLGAGRTLFESLQGQNFTLLHCAQSGFWTHLTYRTATRGKALGA